LGKEMTKALAAAGASVVIVDVDQAAIDEAIQTVDGDVWGLCADVASEAGVATIVEQTNDRFGHLDVLFNNAGISLRTIEGGDSPREECAFYELGSQTVQRFFDVHVMAPFLLSRAVVPQMLERGFGRIVTVTTSLATMTFAKNAPYGPMKAASEAFAAIMARDLADTCVTVNVLIPGGAAATRLVGELRSSSPIDPSVMGPPAVWLASRESDGVTAQRFISSKWDATLPGGQAARLAGGPIAWPAEHLPAPG
jgi:NAD(P)-dependent dehydrogenase (short-subunit alcohol dehydrogenase family)